MLQIDDRMELIAGNRPKSEKARAIKVTNVVRWAEFQRVHLRKEVGPSCTLAAHSPLPTGMSHPAPVPWPRACHVLTLAGGQSSQYTPEH